LSGRAQQLLRGKRTNELVLRPNYSPNFYCHPQGRNQVARRQLPAGKAHHLRRRGGPPRFREKNLPKHPHSLEQKPSKVQRNPAQQKPEPRSRASP
jgi:hypothetical protein